MAPVAILLALVPGWTIVVDGGMPALHRLPSLYP